MNQMHSADNSFWSHLRRVATPVLVAVGLVGVPAVAPAETPPTLTITTGSSTGTYFEVATQIKQILPPDVPLEVVPSDGSIQNLRRLLAYEGPNTEQYYQLAMVQADVLAQLRDRAASDPVLNSIVSRIKVVMPLYSEEIHAFTLVEQQLRSLDDMLTRDVAINAGSENSGTNLTARWLYEQIGATDRTLDWVNAADSEGLPALGGFYDILFSVAGAPSTLGRSLTEAQGVTLVPIEVPELYELPNSPYRPAQLTPEIYPWLKHDVTTMAVDALLVAFDYSEDNPYCDQIEKLTREIVDKLGYWQDPANGGHPKWQEINPRKAANRTDLYACSARVLQRF